MVGGVGISGVGQIVFSVEIVGVRQIVCSCESGGVGQRVFSVGSVLLDRYSNGQRAAVLFV